MDWYITGDTHGKVADRIIQNHLCEGDALIILGDAGFNFYLNETDVKQKELVQRTGVKVFCVRGNHEERPENLGYHLEYNELVEQFVYADPVASNIFYLVDGATYHIDGKSVLVLGGAYSVDKDYRLSKAASDKTWTGWFKDEQLSVAEQQRIFEKVKGHSFDAVFSHTCPLRFVPSQCFLSGIDQSKVDKTMEHWLETVENNINYKAWVFAHYHSNRIIYQNHEENKSVIMLFEEVIPFDALFKKPFEEE